MNSRQQPAGLPRHLGIILDGNRRWAKNHGLPQLEGHRRGYEILKDIGELAIGKGIEYFSAYVFSTENWRRSREEVGYLMNLLYWVATHEVDEMNRKNLRVRFLGSKSRLSPKILTAIEKAEARTAANTKGTVAFCLNYGGQLEIAEAVGKMLADEVPAEDVTVEKISSYLYAPDIPPLDLVIRTSGEQRLSNFMLWRAAYAELYFTSKHWPDFAAADLEAALADYASRRRRFGGDYTQPTNLPASAAEAAR
ncbi:di-trans,poly-cis-decaprenylcistransferase [Candidatus Parcubacteria bacterium]|nr:di-trans,poly-cis-decaprenylcistransferase [Candidatus Parcubacteria bacterium]